MATNDKHWCFTWHAGPDAEAKAVGAANQRVEEAGRSRAGLTKASKWPAGSTIEVSFLDGTDTLKARVKKFATGWLGPKLANLKLVFRNDTQDTPVRISFEHPGSWSTVGTTCRQVPAGQPTMNFGWLDGASDDEARRVVLHEFGHALGLIHEHELPENGIQWDKDAVYTDLSGPPNNWSRAVIDFNMFTAAIADETNFTKTDPESIMMYPIPARWTTDGFSVGLNTDLSVTDKTFIHEQYQ